MSATPNDCPSFQVLRQCDIWREERVALGLVGEEQATALCLSGGGVRSAAFCLGVVQALARRKLLHQFHYLSTVSGGGYVGSWLTRCMAGNEKPTKNSCTLKDVKKVEDILASEAGEEPPDVKKVEDILASEAGEEPPELQRLRRYINYLTPHPGIASVDTWAGVVLWLRNTLINWAVFLPLMLAAASVPVLYAAAIFALTCPGLIAKDFSLVCGAMALLCLGVSVYRACLNLPSHKHPDPEENANGSDGIGMTGSEVFRNMVSWAMGWAFLVPLALAHWLGRTAPAHLPPPFLPAPEFWPAFGTGDAEFWHLTVLPGGGVLVCVLAYLGAWLCVKLARPNKKHAKAFRTNLVGWLVSCIVSGSLLLIGTWLAESRSVLWIAVGGPAWVVAAELLRSAVYVAVRQNGLRTDLDREWLARLSADKLRIAVAYSVAAAAALLLPVLVLDQFPQTYALMASVVAFLGGPVAAMLGKASSSAFSFGVKANKRSIWARTDGIIAVAIALFIAALLMLLGRLGALIALRIAGLPPTELYLSGVPKFAFGTAGEVLLAVAVGISLDRVVNLNRFSMHAVYRNRLVRAFLGTARPPDQRHPDRYTQFDPTDSVRLASTVSPRLFHVFGITLNKTSGKDTARAQRKGEPFIVTPLHCGAASLGPVVKNRPSGAYIATRYYAGADQETGVCDEQHGITLGTAMTLSGAAVSPNMGYHSSFLVAFVMTLFNVRLGAWLPNPGWQCIDKKTAERSGPRFSLPSLLQEFLGQSDDKGKYIYLSDGGHFDNLGLYEMLRRRCGTIVVVDAGCDPDYGYFDLSHTLQQARIDMGIQVTFKPAIKVGEVDLPTQFARATIQYPEIKSECKGELRSACKGNMVYIKPWLPADAPVELAAFKKIKKNFPHDTTANQFFTESDFESYRALGEHLTKTALLGCVEDWRLWPRTLAKVFSIRARNISV